MLALRCLLCRGRHTLLRWLRGQPGARSRLDVVFERNKDKGRSAGCVGGEIEAENKGGLGNVAEREDTISSSRCQ